ncbi:MAG: ABC transporter ATP-binding protein [Clostridiales bacterium]|nr:ABC transporter ATP-binding protein [Clostridiales bacterium]
MIMSKKHFPRTKIQWIWDNIAGLRGVFILAMVGTVVYNFLQLTVPFFSQQIVDRFLTGDDAATHFQANKKEFYILIACMVGITLLRALIVYLDCMAYEHVSQRALYRVRNHLFEKIEHQDMHFYNEYRTGDLMTRLTGDLDAVRHNIAWVVRMIIECFSLFTAASVYFFYMNWKMAICIIALAPVIFLIVFTFRRKVAPMHALLREKHAQMNTAAQENISGNRVVKAFSREDYEIDKFDESNKDYAETNKKTRLVWIKFFPFVETCANLLPVILLWIGGTLLMKDEMTMGEYVAFSGLMWAIANPMRLLGNILNEFQRFSAAADKVMEIYYSEPKIVDAEDAIDHPERFTGKVEFKNVSFQYEDADLPVLTDISFVANPGETVAIMGETGCGKTSLIQLIPRFYEPTHGQVLVDGMDVSKLKLKQLRTSIGMATQDVLLYSDTIDGNIAYGDTNITKENVIKFARYSAADEFISKMPEGYETIVGERGVGLSGGQKQRISLARALAVRPSILILDDTTSAVDMETEKQIQKSLSELDFPCTKIIIAQRISTTKKADRILILQDGKISESGTHDELIKKGGYYAELVKLQTGQTDLTAKEVI